MIKSISLNCYTYNNINLFDYLSLLIIDIWNDLLTVFYEKIDRKIDRNIERDSPIASYKGKLRENNWIKGSWR